jgi:DNA-binding NarL/FixJ family response regulator
MVTILLADDHELARTGLRLILESVPGWQVCAEAENGAAAVDLAGRIQPDVVILDLSMPVMNGLEATEQLRRVAPDTSVLLVTAMDADGTISRGKVAGAHRFLSKTCSATAIVAAVRSLLAARERAGTRAEGRPPGLEVAKLTPREVEVVRLLATGESNSTAGRALCITEKTVETHRANIMRKLSVESIVELVHFAIREQIVQV